MATLRPATPDDIPAIERLIALSARALCAADYTAAQVEAALGTAWGCDSQLIRDGTYFVADSAGLLVACGGWGRRRTLFGVDALPGREPEPLDPARDAARIRAFFVHPDWARRGLGRRLLERCESEARAHGFRAVELMATLTGERFYRQFGYTGEATVEHPLPGGQAIRFVPMGKSLDRTGAMGGDPVDGSMLRVRPCRADDFPEVLALLRQLWPDRPLDANALRVVYDRALRSDSQVYLCATEGARVIGFGSLTIKNNLWQAGPLGHVDELVVDSGHRGRGVGTRLLEELVAAARQRECRRVELDSALNRDGAHRFYRRHGFENRAYLFSKPL